MNLEELRKKILEFNQAYEKGSPIVEDAIYDFYKKKLTILEENENTKISNQIGSNIKSDKKAEHLFRILSLDHDFGKESIENFIKRIEKKTNPFPLIGELKVDGVSLIARYENGILNRIATRGNGYFGEDITHLKNHLAIPNNIYLKDLLEIRFEVYFEKNFIKNPRNAAAGILLKKEIDPNLKHLKFAPHNLYSHAKIWDDYNQLRKIFEALHLTPITPYKICNNTNDLNLFFDEIEARKNAFDFEIDGIVFKVNDKNSQEILGNTAKAPKFAFAIKFNNSFAISKIIDINFQVGRFGKITPVAIIEEAIIDNRKITKATLNNIENLIEKQYSKNDIIKIEMAGQVIPMITEIVEKSENKIEIPENCPECKSKLIENVCVKEWDCIGQKKERLYHFASKHCLNMESIGPKQIDFFIEQEILNYPNDFFEIKNNINKIKSSASWLGEKSLNNIIESIEKSKYTTISSWYTSLGIPHIGKTKAEKLNKNFNNFEEFLKASIEDLEFLGKEVAKDIFNYKEKEKWIKETWKYMKINEEYKNENLISLF